MHPEECEHLVGTLDGGREGRSGDGERNQRGDVIWGRKQLRGRGWKVQWWGTRRGVRERKRQVGE